MRSKIEEMKNLSIAFGWFRVVLIYLGILYSPSLKALEKKPTDFIPMVDQDGDISWVDK